MNKTPSPASKTRSLNRAMGQLHTWAGLPLGWMFFFIFIMGAISFYHMEITFWMQPEIHRLQSSAKGIDNAMAVLQREAPAAGPWTLSLPTERTPYISAMWPDPSAARTGGGHRGGMKRVIIDSETGDAIQPRATAGGSFLYRLHVNLFGLERTTGMTLIAVITLVMFLVLVSGLFVHRTIFKDFFLFRPGRGKLSWRDAHNATAVLSYPFHLVITLSGLLLLCPVVMGQAIQVNYGPDARRFIMATRGMNLPAPDLQAAAGGDSARKERSGREDAHTGSGNETGRDGEHTHSGREASGNPAGNHNAGSSREMIRMPEVKLAPLAPMLDAAAKRWPQGAGSLVITNPARPDATVELRQSRPDVLRGGSGATEKMVFDGVSGKLLSLSEKNTPSATLSVWQTLTAIHRGHFAGPLARFLLFASGLGGAAMVASGLIIWTLNRKKQVNAKGQRPFFNQVVESLNIAFIPGLFIAVACFLAGSRLIPADVADRAGFERQIFFGVWGLCLVHALVRGNRKKAWTEQCITAGVLFVLLPAINAVTGGSHLFSSISNSRWPLVGFELIALILGASFLMTAKKIIRYSPAAVMAAQPGSFE